MEWEANNKMVDMNGMISVIVPALNEANNIGRALDNILDAFTKINCKGEIIVVNDGSTDATEAVVRDLMVDLPIIKLLCHDTPKGIGGSFWHGVNESSGEYAVLISGDGENDCYEILRYLPVMDHVDIVIPFWYNTEVRSWQRRYLSKLYKGIINLTFGLLLNYMNGTVMYRKCVLKNLNLKSTGFFYQPELLIKAIKCGYLYAEVPCELKQRLDGKSKALNIKSLLQVVSGYISTVAAVYFFNPEKKVIAPGSVTAMRYRTG